MGWYLDALVGRSAESASGDVSQLTGRSDGTTSVFRLGSFNVGVDQSKLTSENAKAVLDKVENIITTYAT